MKDKMKWSLSGKNLLVGVIILSGFLMLLVLLISSFTRSKVIKQRTQNVEYSTSFCDGSDWKMIESMSISPEKKLFLKQSLIKVAIESSSLNGVPMVSSVTPIPDYLTYLDNFYQLKDNIAIPIFFGLKIADMAKNGAANSAIIAFRLVVMQRLQMYGLIR